VSKVTTTEETAAIIRAAHEAQALRLEGLERALGTLQEIRSAYANAAYRPSQRIRTRANRAYDAVQALLLELRPPETTDGAIARADREFRTRIEQVQNPRLREELRKANES
jgi:hypothetical protein